MTDLVTYNGDDLLEVFKDLNINLGGLDPNVVRAWFDTDDQDMKNFLYFMCSGLTRENVVSAQEIAEFEALENPLYDTQLENALAKVEQEKPGILDFELNSKLVKISQKEAELLAQEERKLDELLKMDEELHKTLSQNKLVVERESMEIDFKYEEATKLCIEMSNILDVKNQCLHEKLSRDLIALTNYQCNEPSDFFNRKNLDELCDSDEFHKTLEDLVKQQHDVLLGNFSSSCINFNSTPTENNSEDKLVALRNQIASSYVDYVKAKMEEVSLSEVLNYLENFFTQDYLMNDCPNSPSDGMKQKENLLSKLEKKAFSEAEDPIISIKISKCQTELKVMEGNFQCFSRISKCCSKLLSTTSCALMFLNKERNTIEEVNQGIQHISGYILHNLEDTKDRMEMMSKICNDSDESRQRPLENCSKLLSIIVDLYGGTMLKDAYSSSQQLDKNLRVMKHKLFLNNNTEEIVEKFCKNDVAKQFLTSGYTRKAIVIPNPILKALGNIGTNLEKQNAGLKLVLQISNQTLKKLSSDKCLKNSRLLWMYFLTNPKKLKDLLGQIEEEVKRKGLKSVRFKEVDDLCS